MQTARHSAWPLFYKEIAFIGWYYFWICDIILYYINTHMILP